ncbi:MAG: DoxX family membrane protein [Gemmatimonadales bacterium]
MRWLLAVLFLTGGVLHFVIPALYIGIMPPWLPKPALLVAISGAAEIAGGIGLLLPTTRRAAAIGLILLLVAVFPANIQMLLLYRARGVAWWGELLLWLRLPLQFLLIWGVWRVSRPRQPQV